MITLLYMALAMQCIAMALLTIDARNANRCFSDLANFNIWVMLVGIGCNAIAIMILHS